MEIEKMITFEDQIYSLIVRCMFILVSTSLIT